MAMCGVAFVISPLCEVTRACIAARRWIKVGEDVRAVKHYRRALTRVRPHTHTAAQPSVSVADVPRKTVKCAHCNADVK